jgi:acylphosphatase
MSDPIVRRRVIVTGRVQGVWFRDSIRALAAQHGVAGWARNRIDSSVEVVLEGPETAVSTLLAFCRKGPPRAEVLTVQEAVEQPEGLRGFKIL